MFFPVLSHLPIVVGWMSPRPGLAAVVALVALVAVIAIVIVKAVVTVAAIKAVWILSSRLHQANSIEQTPSSRYHQADSVERISSIMGIAFGGASHHWHRIVL